MDCKHPKVAQRYGVTEQPRHIPDVFTGLWPQWYQFCTHCGDLVDERWVHPDKLTDGQLFTLLMSNAECDAVVQQYESQ
jgi:hypothetical protein